MKTKRNIISIALTLAALSACSTPIEQSSSLESSLESAALTSYEGESTMYVYEVFMDRYRSFPEGARFDTTFTVKNGEPIMEKEDHEKFLRMLNPDLSRLVGGTGGYSIEFFYYDFECAFPVRFGDIATKDLELFYYAK